MNKKVRLFSTPTCTYCVILKKYLDDKNIEYEYIDVSQDEEKLKEMVELSGQMGVPVTEIDSKDVIIGFNKKQIDKFLGLN